MTIDQIKSLLNNKLTDLQNRLNIATLTGNIEDVVSLDIEINETKNTLEKLQII